MLSWVPEQEQGLGWGQTAQSQVRVCFPSWEGLLDQVQGGLEAFCLPVFRMESHNSTIPADSVPTLGIQLISFAKDMGEKKGSSQDLSPSSAFNPSVFHGPYRTAECPVARLALRRSPGSLFQVCHAPSCLFCLSVPDYSPSPQLSSPGRRPAHSPPNTCPGISIV